MSDAILNNSIAFIPYPYSREIIGFVTTVVESASGVQQAFNNSGHDRRRFILNLSQYTNAERDIFLNFYRERLGMFDDFLFRDIKENFITRNQIGTGTGALTTFQLKEIRGSREFKRWDIDKISTGAPADPKIWVNNVLQTEGVDYTIDYTSSGIVTFLAGHIPTAGQAVEAEFYYLRRCRFVVRLSDSITAYELINIPITFDEKIVVN